MPKGLLIPHSMRRGKPTVPPGTGTLKLTGTSQQLIIRTGAVLKTGSPKQAGLPNATPELSS